MKTFLLVVVALAVFPTALQAQQNFRDYLGAWRIDLEATESWDRQVEPFRITISQHGAELTVEQVKLDTGESETSRFSVEHDKEEVVVLTEESLVITERRTLPDGRVECVVDTYVTQRNRLELERTVSDGVQEATKRMVFFRLPVNEALHGGMRTHAH